MEDQKKDKPVSAGWYLLGGLAVGAAAGLLLAPKKGSETLEDIAAWRLRTREKTRNLLSRIGSSTKSGVDEAIQKSREKAKEFVNA
ncbi:MAG: YtxH domain-containing protein [Elusimicrobiota bacterium]